MSKRRFILGLGIVVLGVARVGFAGDPYVILGVPPNAQPAAIDAAYARHLAAHRNGVPPSIREAYLLLSDPEKRRKHDAAVPRSVLVRRIAEWRRAVEVQLAYDYGLADRDPAKARANWLRMLETERQKAWDAMFPPGDSTRDGDREATFWNRYREGLWNPWPVILHYTLEHVDAFASKHPTFEEVRRYLELVDMRNYVWLAGAKGSRFGLRHAENDEQRPNGAARRCYGALLDEDRLESLEVAAQAFKGWWTVADGNTAATPVATWIRRSAARFSVAPETVWAAFFRAVVTDENFSFPSLETLVPALLDVFPGAFVLDVLRMELLKRSRGRSSKALGAAALSLASAVRQVVAADPSVGATLESAASFRGAVAAMASETSRCLRALAQAANAPESKP